MITSIAPLNGVNKDLSATQIDPGVFTDAQNVRFREGCAELFLGQSQAYAPAPIAPISTFAIRIGGVRYWIVLSQAKAYAVTGSPPVWTDITRSVGGDYAANLDTLWNGGVLNGVPILNNGVDVPQVWSPLSVGQRLTALTAWPASTAAKVLRPWRNYMFAFDVTKAGTRYPHRVKWSHPADPGSVPVSWDEADATKDAGEFDLDGSGYVIDALPLRQSLVIYKENSTHIASFAGAPLIFNFQQVFSSSGMLSPDCAVEVDGSHVVLTSNDLIIHDGATIRSVIDKATRRWLFKNIDADGYDKCFVTRNVYFNEVWVCFPELGQTRCTRALIYNYKDNTIAFRALPEVTGAGLGLVDEGAGDTFDSSGGSFDSDLGPFNSSEFGAQLTRTLLCSPTAGLLLADNTYQNNGDTILAYMERSGLTLNEPNQVKTLRRMYPRFRAPEGSVMNFRLGAHMRLDDPVVWGDPIPFVVGEDFTVDGFACGRYLAWRMDSAAAGWRLEGIDLDHNVNGGY